MSTVEIPINVGRSEQDVRHREIGAEEKVIVLIRNYVK